MPPQSDDPNGLNAPAEDLASASSSDAEILQLSRERFDLAATAEIEHRKLAEEDMRFRAGEQWEQDVKASRQEDGRPCLVINRLPQFANQVINDQRQNRSSIKVSPVDDEADVETAEVLTGVVRHIEVNSNADIAYDTAGEHQVYTGLGYFRVITGYSSPTSFEQEIYIKRIQNPGSVYLDPNYSEPDGSDADYGFVFEEFTTSNFKAMYPKAQLSQMQDWETIGSKAPGWINKGSVRVAEYFYKTFEPTTIFQLTNGQVVTKAQLDQIVKDPNTPPDLGISGKRETVLPAIKWCKHNGIEILERTDWLGQWIPIIPVQGAEIFVDGRRIFEGIIRHAKDPQRMYNYWASAETEAIALAPKAPFIIAEGQVEGHEKKWDQANRKNYAYLPYKPTTIAGMPAPPPMRQAIEPAVQAISQARMLSSEDLKATTGIYDAALGNKSNENSGIAIQRRNQQAQTSNFHFMDNMRRSKRQAGRIIVDLIPHVYDTARVARMLGEDGEAKIVKLNQEFQEKGQTKIFDVTTGQYDVVVDDGPSYQTKRQEAAAMMGDLIRAFPPLMATAGDILVRNIDLPGSRELADRLKKTLPPGLADDKEQAPIPPEVKAKMDQQGAMIEQLTQELQGHVEETRMKKAELESKERIAKMDNETKLAIAALNTSSAEGLAVFREELAHVHHRESLQSKKEISSETVGAEGALANEDELNPTGGTSPGQPME